MNEFKYYTTKNKLQFVDEDGFPRSYVDSNDIVAKAIKEVRSKNILERSPSHFKYYVKIEPNRSLHDPLCRATNSKSKPSFVDKICKSENSFMEVNQSVFDKYINYLKTENNQWLVDAIREVK